MTISKKMELGSFPTPLQSTTLPDGTLLMVKREDVSSSFYGGNKIRKLEYVLNAAKDRGASSVTTVGALGSNHVLATALFASRLGLSTTAMVYPRPRSVGVARTTMATLKAGATLVTCGGMTGALFWARRHVKKSGSYWIEMGGSDPLGTQGYVDCAKELFEQFRAEGVSQPDRVVVACGSGGTAAGLAIGLAQLGANTRVIGVAVAGPTWIMRWAIDGLIRRTAKAIGQPQLAKEAINKLMIVGDQIGRGYGFPLKEDVEVVEAARACGIELDSTYTYKAFAYAHRIRRESKSLYLHSLSATKPAFPDDEGALPPNLRKLLRSP